MPRSTATDDDRTARARIRDAAIARFAADGFVATNLKDIAADAGVSVPLIAHHFGSRDGLRHECDRHVAARIRSRKLAYLQQGEAADPMSALRDGTTELPYLARSLADGSHHVAALVDELVDDAVDYIAAGVAAGTLKPTDHPRERAVVLVIWQLGALALHEHVERLLGASLVGPAEGMLAWLRPASEILATGVIEASAYDALRSGIDPSGAAHDEGAT